MAKKLKHYLSKDVVQEIALNVEGASRHFDSARFNRLVSRDLESLELFDRARHIANALRIGLPSSYKPAVRILVSALGPPREEPGYGSYDNLRYLPFTTFISLYGLNDPETSLPALREMTRRFTSEFDIRPFLTAHYSFTMNTLRKWTQDPDIHVRRLASEGVRPRLPWAEHLKIFKKDPAPLLRLLNRLRDDPERYVQKSVANNIMDVLKDNPGAAYSTLNDWARKSSPNTKWIIHRALRERSQTCSKAEKILNKLDSS